MPPSAWHAKLSIIRRRFNVGKVEAKRCAAGSANNNLSPKGLGIYAYGLANLVREAERQVALIKKFSR